uniref:SFRICE_030973 n=1 Tax=Spodoptera frugiperda TaxID=7108 RepID=A0A2H1V5N9_SPOFR
MAKSTVESSVDLAAIILTSKIPEFWVDSPHAWFYRIEAMLAPQKLSDDWRFDIVVSKLTKEAIQQVTDLLMDPPEGKKFESLKTRLLAIYEESKNRQLQKLISEVDQKPSQLLRRMRELAKEKIPDNTLRMLWQGHLPSPLRAVLAVTESKDLDSLTVLADNVFETTRATHVSEVGQQQPSTSKETDLIMAEIAKLTMKVEQLERSNARSRPQQQNWNRSRSAPRTGSRARSASRRTPESPDWLCFYHYWFRTKAKKCNEPCSWKSSSEN